jgi:tRNA dimethylallyltransferase
MLNERIDRRIDTWIANGFLEEVQSLLGRGYAPTLPSMSGIGYREVAEFLAGRSDLETAVNRFKLATRQYAKRQMTWFGARRGVHWFDAETVTAEQVLSLARPE